MSTLVTNASVNVGGALHRRAVALANIRWFRALAQRAVRDGGPQAQLRAANARAAARIILRQAKREAVVGRIARDALAADL
ncbi:hypothetical protein ACRBEV_06260 [Methylobacterium phyllosphaerae]